MSYVDSEITCKSRVHEPSAHGEEAAKELVRSTYGEVKEWRASADI
jgi:hypothetical protein